MVHKADLVIIGICVGVAFGILIASLVFFGIRWYKRRVHLQHHPNERSLATLPIRTNGLGTSVDFSASLSNSVAIKTSGFPATKPLHSWWSHPSKDQFASASGLPRYFYKDIQKATQNFTTILGQGSFGPVYKATMPAGGVVAVKVLATDSKQGEKEFFTEAVPPVIHRDLKTANILLDQSMRAKVADFGLSKEEVYDGRNSGLKGTYGYIDPMYISTSKFTTKSDIYSFGIILFELITAIHPHQNLMEYVNLAAMSSDGVDEILDKKLVGTCSVEQVRSLAAIAHKCIHRTPRKRPSMGEISHAILKIKQRRLVKEDTMSFTRYDSSRMARRIEHQQVELRNMASINEREVE